MTNEYNTVALSTYKTEMDIEGGGHDTSRPAQDLIQGDSKEN